VVDEWAPRPVKSRRRFWTWSPDGFLVVEDIVLHYRNEKMVKDAYVRATSQEV
jgi:hypothetical protein